MKEIVSLCNTKTTSHQNSAIAVNPKQIYEKIDMHSKGEAMTFRHLVFMLSLMIIVSFLVPYNGTRNAIPVISVATSAHIPPTVRVTYRDITC